VITAQSQESQQFHSFIFFICFCLVLYFFTIGGHKMTGMKPGGAVNGDGTATGEVHARRAAAVDLAILAGFMVALNWITLGITERYAGPITASCAVALISGLLWRRGTRWRDLGLRRPTRPRWLFAQVPVVLVAWLTVSAVAAVLVGQYLPRPDTSARFGDLAGNLPATLWWIGIGWLIGGFAEEMIFRGFLLNRLAVMAPRGILGSVMAVLLQAALFGAVHVYNRGLFGLLVLGAIGVVMGTSFLLLRRNLWPVILAHGLGNTLGFLARYFDLK
jgi:membrane protease YdiL (CAAX protease family)